ncbi:MAG: GNAT family N-acetyltransferase [Oryzomicrobium sp.]|nr:GNAT family N-acetyltransferase [Oryzomicrobium sp.]MCE1242300.1 GNAT family N-acetyltransferase [Oryzomicrobium sp.]
MGDIRVVDIALLRDYRRLGVGGGLLQRLIDEAERGIYLFMIRPPMAMAAGQP